MHWLISIAIFTQPIFASNPSFEKDVRPVIIKRCTPCHTGVIKNLPNFTIYDIAFKKKKLIKHRVWDTLTMPPGNNTNMTPEERKIIRNWVNSGGKK